MKKSDVEKMVQEIAKIVGTRDLKSIMYEVDDFNTLQEKEKECPMKFSDKMQIRLTNSSDSFNVYYEGGKLKLETNWSNQEVTAEWLSRLNSLYFIINQ